MVVDPEGNFVTQRTHPDLARIVPQVSDEALDIAIDGTAEHLRIPSFLWKAGPKRTVTVWKYTGPGIDQGDAAAQFLSDHLHAAVRLVRMPDDGERIPKRRPEGLGAEVGFADAYPLLLTTDASLAELNRHLPDGHPPIPMDRFRPNIVVSGAEAPWEEETWRRFEIDGILFHGVKRCDRCDITRVDQTTGERVSKEPLATLARIHREGGKVLFGMNLIHAAIGPIRVGSPVRHIQFGERPEL